MSSALCSFRTQGARTRIRHVAQVKTKKIGIIGWIKLIRLVIKAKLRQRRLRKKAAAQQRGAERATRTNGTRALGEYQGGGPLDPGPKPTTVTFA